MREATANVDILSFFRDAPELKLNPVSLNIDDHFSDVKDVNYAIWQRFSIASTLKVLWDEYQKKKSEIDPFKDIPEPLW